MASEGVFAFSIDPTVFKKFGNSPEKMLASYVPLTSSSCSLNSLVCCSNLWVECECLLI